MALTAKLKSLFALGGLRHKGALNTQQFDELKNATREDGVSAETLSNLDTLGGATA